MNASRFLLAGLALGFTAIAYAQTQSHTPGNGRGAGPHGGRMGPPAIVAIDTDKDGVLSADEITAAPTALATLDANGDGKVSLDEMHAKHAITPPQAPQPPKPPARPHVLNSVMLALDADKDGEFSSTEIANASASLKALDANNDGQLTLEELRPLKGEGFRHGQGGRGGRGQQSHQGQR